MSSATPEPGDLQVHHDPVVDSALPLTMRHALRAEVHRVTRPPFETLLTVAINGALMSSMWFFLPTDLVDQVFSLHGSLAFAFVLSSWMYSDVPATNVLGSDAIRVLGAIDQPVVLRRMLMAKSTVLWCIVAPVCMLISVIMGSGSSDKVVALYSAIAIGVIPFGVLSISAWVGIRFPYHPSPIRFRLQERRNWKPMFVRWGTLVLLPYAVVPALTGLFLAPSLLIWGLTSSAGLSKKLPDNNVGLGIALACAISLAATYFGHRYSLRMIAQRRDKLVAYLSDPLLG